ncbi:MULTISPECIES: hypothetical protein [Microvirga]|uniref:hypothetical protein n=1 Tax=Microvirga TaxID=186650 RepID=UPI001D00093D|nr:hypothetical protein [Microvirga lenta]MCB5174984.1 hypothetical protein [Microvirga lenta]
MAEPKNMAGLEGSQSVSALGLRWAALRGMLTSPLIMVEEQRGLREELLRELGTIEQEFVSLQSRNTMEISAKIDIAKSALRDGLQAGHNWLVDLLDSIQTDLHLTNAKPAAPARPTTNLVRAQQQRPDGGPAPTPEAEQSPAA